MAYQKQRRNLQTKAKTTPARIDEQKRTISEYEAVDFTALRTRRDELAGQESAAREALEQLGARRAPLRSCPSGTGCGCNWRRWRARMQPIAVGSGQQTQPSCAARRKA